MVFVVTIKLRSGQRLAGVGWFLDQDEAVMQTSADWPDAQWIKTRHLSWGAPR